MPQVVGDHLANMESTLESMGPEAQPLLDMLLPSKRKRTSGSYEEQGDSPQEAPPGTGPTLR